MNKKIVVLSVFLFLLSFGAASQAATWTDDFNTPYDYAVNSIVDSPWQAIFGFGPGDTGEALNASITTAGSLRVAALSPSASPYCGEPVGAALARRIKGNFSIEAKVTAHWFRRYHSNGGLWAFCEEDADAGAGCDGMMYAYFPCWTSYIGWPWNDGGRTEEVFAAFDPGEVWYADKEYMKLTRSGNVYQGWYSDDGITWTADVFNRTRTDITSSMVVQVGLYHCMADADPNGWTDFDYFTVTADEFVPSLKAGPPLPADGAVDVNYLSVTLRWRAGDQVQAVNGHELYVSTDIAKVQSRDPSVKHVLSVNSYLLAGPLPLSATYYWCVDEINGATKWSGDIWSFTTTAVKATNPNPENKRGGVDPSVANLIWTPGGTLVLNQDVYFSDSFTDVDNGAPAALVASNIAGDANSIATPGIPLLKGKLYFWRVDSKCGGLGNVKGDVWQFKTAFPVEICDNFETEHDYMVSGTTGTIWDGIIGKDTIITLATDYNLGKLYMESGNNAWDGGSGDPSETEGAFLYKEIVGAFIADVEVTAYPGLDPRDDAAIVWHNWGGLMARVGNLDAAGPGEDWITTSYFPIWGNGNRTDVCGWYTTTWQIFAGITGTGWDGGRFLQLESDGEGTFFQRWSADGITYYSLNTGDQPWADGHQITVTPTLRPDMAGLPLQIGLCHATYSGSIGYMEFDNFCFGRDLIAKAYSPQPTDGGGLDLMRAVLSWAPGDFAGSHIVHFGTDPNALVNRGSANVVGPDGSGRFSYNAGSFETLAIGNTYYWRIDEVNATHPDSPWIGNVWSFTVLDYTTIDSFEQYISTGFPSAPGTLRKVWIDGYWSLTKIIPAPPPGQPAYKITSSASFVQLNTDPADGGANPGSLRYFNDADIALLGKKSMKLYYENDGFYQWIIWLYGADIPTTKYTAPKFSEVVAAIDDAARLVPATQESLGLKRNWSGYKLLRIPFYGDPNNTLNPTDKLYVGLWDGDNNPTTPVVIVNSDNTKLQKNWWQDWYIPLSSFPAANANFSLSNVARIYIGIGDRTTPVTGGTGNIFFDEIQLLSQGVCIPGTQKTDFNNDCRTDMNDLELMTELWLAQVPAGAGPIINLDASALAVGNLTSWSNAGTGLGKFDANTADAGAIPVVAMVEGRKAVVFDGNDFMIWKDAANAIKAAPASITANGDWTVIIQALNHTINDDEEILAWAKRGWNDRYSAMNYGTSGAYGAAAHWGGSDLGFDRGVPPAHLWHTIGITYDGATETVVVDGVINASEDKTLNIWDANAVVLGTYSVDAYDPNVVPPLGSVKWGNSWIVPARTIMFSGSVSKIEVYDYAMTPGQLAMKMGSPINLINDTIINFKDFAVLANKWLVGPVLLQ